MPSSTSKSLTRKKKAAQQFRRGSKTFRRNKKLRQNISVKKLYTKGKRFKRGGGGFVEDFRDSILIANRFEETERRNKEIDNECSLCLSRIAPHTDLTLRCGHIFHKDCIKQLILAGHYRCPLCRGTISYTREEVDMAKVVLKEAAAVMIAAEARSVAAVARVEAAMKEMEEAEAEMEVAAGEVAARTAVARTAWERVRDMTETNKVATVGGGARREEERARRRVAETQTGFRHIR